MTYSKYSLNSLIYFSSTAITVLWMLSGGLGAITGAEFMIETINMLGYPSYFPLLLGCAKIIGLLIIVLPINNYIKLFAYSGVVFELLSASLSYFMSGLLFPDSFIPLPFLVVVILSLIYWLKVNGLEFRSDNSLLSSTNSFDPQLITNTSFVKLYRTFKVLPRNEFSLQEYQNRNGADNDREFYRIDLSQVSLAIPVYNLAYHHIAQGKFQNENYMITFCPVCNSGMLFVPMVNDKVLDFQVAGVYRGMMLMSDKQTNSYWDHITGECMYGEYLGERLQKIDSHRIVQEKEFSKNQIVIVPRISWVQSHLTKFQNNHTWKKVPAGKFYPGFKASFDSEDLRRPEKELGLGVFSGDAAKFYPLSTIKAQQVIRDEINEVPITIFINENTYTPECNFDAKYNGIHFTFCRWYGFAQTFSDVIIYK